MVQITTHLLSIERADWPKLHDMFKARDANVWQREFPVGFPVEVSALNSLFINIFRDVVARIESRCVIKAKHVFLVCLFVLFYAGKTALALKRSYNFSRVKLNELTDQQDMFLYTHEPHILDSMDSVTKSFPIVYGYIKIQCFDQTQLVTM